MKDITPRLLQFQFFKNMEIVDVDCGVNYACAITSEGEVYSWGSNTFMQLGYKLPQGKKKSSDDDFARVPRKIEYFSEIGVRIKQISCSKGEKHNHTGALTEDGRVFMWGDPYKG